MEEAATPFYIDWAFWAVIVALAAVVLSQLPPVHIWFKRAKLDVELYSKIGITHKVGNPNLQLHLIINNIGGRKARIKDISVSIARDGSSLVELPVAELLAESE